MSRPEQRTMQINQISGPYGRVEYLREVIINKGRLPKTERTLTRSERNGLKNENLGRRKERRINTVLELGKNNIISPCDTCPLKDKKTLCGKEGGVMLQPNGSLKCPDGKGVISIITTNSK